MKFILKKWLKKKNLIGLRLVKLDIFVRFFLLILAQDANSEDIKRTFISDVYQRLDNSMRSQFQNLEEKILQSLENNKKEKMIEQDK